MQVSAASYARPQPAAQLHRRVHARAQVWSLIVAILAVGQACPPQTYLWALALSFLAWWTWFGADVNLMSLMNEFSLASRADCRHP